MTRRHHFKGRTASGKRSPLEDLHKAQFEKAGVKVAFEPFGITYIVPPKKYKPDWLVLHNGILIESKGWFQSSDRSKLKLIKQQYPALDLRIVFAKPHTKIGKKSETTYAMWADRMGIPWAEKNIPKSWLREKPNALRLAALKAARGEA